QATLSGRPRTGGPHLVVRAGLRVSRTRAKVQRAAAELFLVDELDRCKRLSVLGRGGADAGHIRSLLELCLRGRGRGHGTGTFVRGAQRDGRGGGSLRSAAIAQSRPFAAGRVVRKTLQALETGRDRVAAGARADDAESRQADRLPGDRAAADRAAQNQVTGSKARSSAARVIDLAANASRLPPAVFYHFIPPSRPSFWWTNAKASARLKALIGLFASRSVRRVVRRGATELSQKAAGRWRSMLESANDWERTMSRRSTISARFTVG